MKICQEKYCVYHNSRLSLNKCLQYYDIENCSIVSSKNNPMNKIRKSRKELENKIREACKDFTEETGAAITNVDVDLTEVTSVGGGPMETVINYVKVEIGDK